MNKYKVWLEISKSAIRKNIKTFRGLLGPRTKLFAVVKSNAYGHDLLTFSSIANAGVDGFCVDSVVEGVKLRKNGIKKPILVLGYTLPHLYKTASENDIAITISNFEALQSWIKSKHKSAFHLKIDTGMHRQGFYAEQLPVLARKFKGTNAKFKKYLTGVYTHFAAAKDLKDQRFTERQREEFQKALTILDDEFKKLVTHASATGGTLLGVPYHFDAVRVGIGLYGVWPSEELKRQLDKKIHLYPALAWRSIISEIKLVKKGGGVGYDVTERMRRPTRIAIVPMGYWHGLPRGASSVGYVYIGNRKARIVGRVSMDVIAIDVTSIPCRVGSVVRVEPIELARVLKASPYEIITRINPLIFKKVV